MRTKRQAACLSAFRRTPLFAAVACALAAPSAMAQAWDPNELIVTTTATDGSPGSLPYAINYANSFCDTVPAPTISFNITGTAPFVISPSSPLPQLYCEGNANFTPTLDGWSQTGTVKNTSDFGFNAKFPVVIDGASYLSGGGCIVSGALVTGHVVTMKGLEIRNFTYGAPAAFCAASANLFGNRVSGNSQGVIVNQGSTIGADGNENRNVIANHFYGQGLRIGGGNYSIVNNFIGIDENTDGIVFDSPNDYGIYWSCCSQMGGTISKNVFSSNNYNIHLEYDNAANITDNKFGTNAQGTSMLGTSGSYGISLYYSYGAQISGNTIAGQGYGIYSYQGQGGVNISNNKIGTDVSGNSPFSNDTGVYIGWGYGTVIENNVISGNVYEGIALYSADGTSILNNRIGVNDGASATIPNETGIYDSFAYGTSASGNTIAGNNDTGIYLSGTQDSNFSNNYIGTNAANVGSIGNFTGVYVGGGSAFNNTFDSNTISGNFMGVYFADTSQATLSNNKIGTTTDGLGAVPNLGGVFAECGGFLTFNGNVISANMYGGVVANGIQNSTFTDNLIGIGSGGGALPNGGHGIEIGPINCGISELSAKGAKAAKAAKSAKALLGDVESDANTFDGNVIANNSGKGVYLVGGSNNVFEFNTVKANALDGIRIEPHLGAYGAVLAAATGNRMTENGVYGNGAKNINLGFDGGPLPNDADDADGSPPDIGRPNNWQNRPTVLSASRNPMTNMTTVVVELMTGAGTYHLELFSNPSPGGPGGKTFVASSSPDVVYAAPGTQTYTFTIGGIGEDNFAATATRVDSSDTSEFSDVVAASTVAVPGVSVLPASWNFGDVVVGRQSGPQTVTISSNGTAPYVIGQLRDASCTGPSICSTGAFLCSTDCTEGTPYNPGNACTITAKFAPTALGSQTHTLALCDNAAGSPRTITFNGNGVPTPEVDISINPRTFYFGEVLLGLQSPPKSFTISNAGATQVYLGAVRTTGDYVLVGTNCAGTLAGGASCSADVAFAPAVKGFAGGTVEVTGSNTPPPAGATLRTKVTTPTTATVSSLLEGTGVQFGDLRLPPSISFGTSVLHSSTARQTLTLTNTGNGPLAISSITVSGPFTLSNPCGATLAQGASCTLTLEFNPAALGTFTGTLTIISDAPGGSRTIALNATVSADPRPVVRVSPVLVGFGERVIGTTSPAQRITITNEGASVAQLGTITFTQATGQTEFSLSGNTCGQTLAPQASCAADVVMKPLGFGSRTGTMLVPSNSPDTPAAVTLGGTGCRPFAAGGNRSGRDPCAP